MNRSLAASSSSTSLSPSRLTVFGLIVLGYIANLMSGYGTTMGPWRPVPLYVCLAVGLLVFQHVLSTKRSFGNGLYINLTSGFALVYAVDLILNTSTHGNFTRDAQTYLLINGFLFLAYWGATIRDWWTHLSRQWLSTVGADMLGFALINLISAALLYVLQVTLGVTVDLAQIWPLSPAGHYHLLYQVELFSAGISAVIAFFLVGAAVVLTSAQGEASPVSEIMHALANMVSRACRTALAPLVWIGTGIVLAVLSQHVTQFYAEAAGTRAWYTLFTPMSQFRQARLDQEVISLGLSAGAVLSTLISVLLANQDRTLLQRACVQVKKNAQILLLSSVFFILSLTGLNAVVVAMGVTQLEPFQLGLLSALSTLALAAYQLIHAVQRKPAATASAATGTPQHRNTSGSAAPAEQTETSHAGSTALSAQAASTAFQTTPGIIMPPEMSYPTTNVTANGATTPSASFQSGGKSWMVWEDENGTLHASPVALSPTAPAGTALGQTSQQPQASQPVLVMMSASDSTSL